MSGFDPLSKSIAEMTPGQLNAAIDKRMDDRPAGQVPGLIDLIAATTPPGTIRLRVAGTPSTGWLACDGSFVPKAAWPALDALLSARMYPYGSTASEFAVPDLDGPDDDTMYEVKT